MPGNFHTGIEVKEQAIPTIRRNKINGNEYTTAADKIRRVRNIDK